MPKKPSLDDLLAENVVADSAFSAPSGKPISSRLTINEESPASWLDVEKIEDNPYQPRLEIEPSALNDLKNDIDRNGQLQSILVRPHPTRDGWHQVAAGHRRKYAVRAGANAGIKTEFPREKIGQILAVVRKLSDEEMLSAAWSENEARQSFTVFDRANFFEMAKKVAPGNVSEKEVSWNELAQRYGIAPTTIKRIVAVRLLPENVRERLKKVNLAAADEPIERVGEKHVRALQMLDGAAQLGLLREIEENRISGNAALRRADALRAAERTNERETAPSAPKEQTTPSATKSSPSPETATSPNLTPQTSGFASAAQNDDATGIPSSTKTATSDAMLEHLAQARAQIEIAAVAATGKNFGEFLRNRVLDEVEVIENEAKKLRQAVNDAS